MAIQFGHVYVLHAAIAGKEKLLVPAFTQGSLVRYFVINSERTQFQTSRPEVCKHVLALSVAKNNTFLTHDSWLTCHEVIGGPTVEEIAAKDNCYRGPLDAETTAAVRLLIEESRLHSEADRKAILNAWPAAPAAEPEAH